MLNVLIVDDEAPIRHWLEYCVNQLDGFWVSATAKNGLQGIEEYKKTLPRPRNVTDLAFNKLRDEVTDLIKWW